MFLHGSHEGRQCSIFTRKPASSPRKRSAAKMAVKFGPLEERIIQAIDMCEKKDSPCYPQALLQYAEETMEVGLKTADLVTIPGGKVVKRSVRERQVPERYSPLI